MKMSVFLYIFDGRRYNTINVYFASKIYTKYTSFNTIRKNCIKQE